MWVGAGFNEITIATNSEQLLAVYSATILALRPFTILRTRLAINIRSDQSSGAEGFTGAYGEIVVKETATGIGVTALPGTLADPDSDWYVYQGMSAPTELTPSTPASFSWSPGFNYIIDSKAMRKVGPTDDIAVLFESRSQGGALINVEGRQLIQLH
jgi:hypothetical protein